MRRPLPITLASRRGWNRLVDRYFAGRLAEVSVLPPPRWRHPWFCSLRYDQTSTSWTVAIRPGWCESPTGDPSPEMRTLARLAPRSPEAEEADALQFAKDVLIRAFGIMRDFDGLTGGSGTEPPDGLARTLAVHRIEKVTLPAPLAVELTVNGLDPDICRGFADAAEAGGGGAPKHYSHTAFALQ